MAEVEPQSLLEETDEQHWISISDMMTGLMVIFLLIAISYMILIQSEKRQIHDIARTYQQLKKDLYRDLKSEFQSDLDRWNAKIYPESLIIRFTDQRVLFERGESRLSNRFKNILEDFFPRYVRLLTQEPYRSEIEEVRIEGHTSSEWKGTSNPRLAYFHNMELSQDRTRSVLEYALRLGDVQNHFDWLKRKVTANGLSSSHPLTSSNKLVYNDPNGTEDHVKSRRVEFRVLTKAEKRIHRILEQGM